MIWQGQDRAHRSRSLRCIGGNDLENFTIPATDACETIARGHSILLCEEGVKTLVMSPAVEEPEVASEKLTRAMSMARPGSARNGGGEDGGGEYVTVVASSSSSVHEASKYVTASIDELQIAAAIEKRRGQGWLEVADHVREGTAWAVKSFATELVVEESEAASQNLTRTSSTVQADSVRSSGGQEGGDECVTAVASSSSSVGHEARKYVTASMDEEQIAAAIAKSREQGWSEVADHVREGAAGASWSGGLSEADRLLWEKLKEETPGMFMDLGERVKLGRVIAEGGQAHIYEASIDGTQDDYVAKVFKMEGFSLADLHRQWPRATRTPDNEIGFEEFGWMSTTLGAVVFGSWMTNCSEVHWGTFLKNGQFAFIAQKYWGDLRTLINLRLVENNYQGPPFSNNEVLQIMWGIAVGMKSLHGRGVLHKDLKAANVLMEAFRGDLRYFGWFECYVADYESSMLVQGTGFWRAPEVLEDLLKKPCERNKGIWTEKVDVYGYAMTCYEVLTGHTPFEGYVKSDWKRVIDGERPHLPEYVDPELRELVERCWHKVPSERPTFEAIHTELHRSLFS